MKNLMMLCLLVVLPVTFASAQDMGPVRGDAQHGALLFYQHGCFQCHGFNGYGRQDLNDAGSVYLNNEEVFRAYLRGRQNEAPLFPSTSMPNYPVNALSDAQVSDIYAYVRSLTPNAPDIEDEATLQAILDSADRPYSP